MRLNTIAAFYIIKHIWNILREPYKLIKKPVRQALTYCNIKFWKLLPIMSLCGPRTGENYIMRGFKICTPHITVLKIKMLNKRPLGIQIEDWETEWEKIKKKKWTRGVKLVIRWPINWASWGIFMYKMCETKYIAVYIHVTPNGWLVLVLFYNIFPSSQVVENLNVG